MSASTEFKDRDMATPEEAAPDLDDINFKSLAQEDSEFGKLWTKCRDKGGINWKNVLHQQTLAKAVLRVYFKVEVDLPSDRLIPSVPVRYQYIQWIQRLLESCNSFSDLDSESNAQSSGLDVGVGASCIFPLLGCAANPNWRFYGTDIDERSISVSNSNIFKNELSFRIRLYLMTTESPLFPLDIIGAKTLDFTMCNPPFYGSRKEIEKRAAAKGHEPKAVCTGADVEMITPGGEVAFATRMLDESCALATRVRWYTTMLSKKESIEPVITHLKEAGCTNWAITKLKPGEFTVRWVVGWSWASLRPALASLGSIFCMTDNC